jgi:hypothetical protein
MNQGPTENYRMALESDEGDPVSAGARLAHIRASAEASKTAQFDLSAVPVELRPSLLVEIRELIQDRAAKSRLIGPMPQTAAG